MPSQLVNNTLSSLSGGVTQQYQEGRFDSQVSSMDNCIPSITRGVIRRNPVNYTKKKSRTAPLRRCIQEPYAHSTAKLSNFPVTRAL